METPIVITLKDGMLNPSAILLNIPSESTSCVPSILLKIVNTKSQTLSEVFPPRKYIFAIEELSEQSEPLSVGDEYVFSTLQSCQNGKYHIKCLNYPKLQCQIEIVFEERAVQNQKKNNPMINLLVLEAVEEKQQQNKEDLGKEESSQTKSDGVGSTNPNDQLAVQLVSKHCNQTIAGTENYERILLSQKYLQQSKQNRYLRYFQQQFKVWRNFFQDKQSLYVKETDVFTPMKQKPKSQYGKNSQKIQKSQINSWQKMEIESPSNIKLTHSCGTPQYNQNLSEFEKDKLELQKLTNDEKLEKQSKNMKKTNSEKQLNAQKTQEVVSQQETVQKSAGQKGRTNTFMEWIDCWTNNCNPLHVKFKSDDNVIKQWLGHLGNKYKVTKFLCE